jgi:hypothetical protein
MSANYVHVLLYSVAFVLSTLTFFFFLGLTLFTCTGIPFSQDIPAMGSIFQTESVARRFTFTPGRLLARCHPAAYR